MASHVNLAISFLGCLGRKTLVNGVYLDGVADVASLIGITAFVLAFACCVACRETWPRNIGLTLGAIAFSVIGAALSQLTPYVLLLAIACLITSQWRAVDKKKSRALFWFATTSSIGCTIVVIGSLFKSPIDNSRENEDRENWEPPPVVGRTPQEVLALDWSSRSTAAYWPVADLLLDLSEIAYSPPAEARTRIRQLGWESESINAGAMQGYVVDAGDDAIVTLRGTEKDEYDIIQDLRFLGVRTAHGAMHGGFAKGYIPMHRQVTDLLERFETKRVWITGHSLGGGLAIVCAHQLINDGRYPIAGVMTFGQPKVVRHELAEFLGQKLGDKYVFFVNDMDPVTRLISPYEHFGHMVRWTDSEIERSSFVLKSIAPSNVATESFKTEAGYVDGMTDGEFQDLLQKAEDAQKPKYDENGNLLVQGYIPNVYDHFLGAYRNMLEKLRTHKSNRPSP